MKKVIVSGPTTGVPKQVLNYLLIYYFLGNSY